MARAIQYIFFVCVKNSSMNVFQKNYNEIQQTDNEVEEIQMIFNFF